MADKIEDWQLADSLGSWELAIEEVGKRFKAGEPLPSQGYFARKLPKTPEPAKVSSEEETP